LVYSKEIIIGKEKKVLFFTLVKFQEMGPCSAQRELSSAKEEKYWYRGPE
jgi:hypothetical protein